MEKPFIDQIIRLSSADGVTPDNFIVFLGPLNLIDFSQNDFYTCYLNRYSIIIYIYIWSLFLPFIYRLLNTTSILFITLDFKYFILPFSFSLMRFSAYFVTKVMNRYILKYGVLQFSLFQLFVSSLWITRPVILKVFVAFIP